MLKREQGRIKRHGSSQVASDVLAPMMEAYVHAGETFGVWCSRESSRDVGASARVCMCWLVRLLKLQEHGMSIAYGGKRLAIELEQVACCR